jgi:hemerythrin superfamily protein
MLTQLTFRVPVLIKSLLYKSDRKLTATELLIQDHLKFEGLFLQLRLLNQLSERFPSRAKDVKKRREDVFGRIRKDLEKHLSAEENVFYPECEKHEEVRILTLEAYEEHQQVKKLLKDLSHLELDDDKFEAKLILLIEDLEHHVREEEGNFFPRIRRLFSHTQLMKLAGQIRSHKKQTRRSKTAAAA